MTSNQSNVKFDYSMNSTQSFTKRYNQQQKQIKPCISSYSSMTTLSESSSNTKIMKKTENESNSLRRVLRIGKQKARPLGICVRKCSQCRQLKHILLAECTVCYRMMDVDLKDCKCQTLTNKNIIDHFICSICNSELTLDGYILCANRTCQTVLSALINTENNCKVEEISVISPILTDVHYPKLAHRTVAIQINTLINLPSLQRFLPNITDDENEETSSSSSSLSGSKRELDWTIVTSPKSSDISFISSHNNINRSLNDLTRNITAAFNSNRPTKLAFQSENKLKQQLSEVCNIPT